MFPSFPPEFSIPLCRLVSGSHRSCVFFFLDDFDRLQRMCIMGDGIDPLPMHIHHGRCHLSVSTVVCVVIALAMFGQSVLSTGSVVSPALTPVPQSPSDQGPCWDFRVKRTLNKDNVDALLVVTNRATRIWRVHIHTRIPWSLWFLPETVNVPPESNTSSTDASH